VYVSYLKVFLSLDGIWIDRSLSVETYYLSTALWYTCIHTCQYMGRCILRH
jgi:hypothetical protein